MAGNFNAARYLDIIAETKMRPFIAVPLKHSDE